VGSLRLCLFDSKEIPHFIPNNGFLWRVHSS
jgi:hypothetical protein